MKTKVRVTSLLAFQELLPKLGERELQVFRTLKQIQPANNLMIAEHLNLPVNCITGRIFSLRKYGVVIFYKKEVCPITKKLTIYWKIPSWITEIMI